MRDETFGTWNFHVSKDIESVNLFESKEVCTHKLPNRVQIIDSHHRFQFDSEDIYKVNLLREGGAAEAVLCPEGG
jgi:hypothetical protein